MNVRARGRLFAVALGALAALSVFPGKASAQPNALLPDIYIKRQRPCPGLEDPRYGYIRENYYGYFPTCWRRFPPGWGCPSADAPNWAAELQRLPLDVPQDLNAPAGDNAAPNPLQRVGDPFERRPAPRTEGTLPDLPPDRDPLFPREGQPETNPTGPETPPAAPSNPGVGTGAGSGAGAQPNEGGPTAAIPMLDPTESAPVAPPIAPPSAAVQPSLPEIPTTSINDGVMPPTRSQPRRGPIAQFLGRVRRK